ncbi:MAG TPA: glycosyltransferase family 39 protein [Gaiellaceae bacterium]|nr:glycosyltransferase family 39 protein [Gaiellaceae bacterium]
MNATALDRLRRSRHFLPIVVLTAVFIGSRGLIRALGVEFDTSSLRYFWQYLDVPLLQHHLLSSLWNLHSQPPLYNLWLGLDLKIAGSHAETFMHLQYVALGFAFTLLLYGLFERVTARRRLSVVAAALISVSPAVLLYENWLFYEYPVAVLLVAALFVLALFVERGSPAWGVTFFMLVAALVYTRATFQLPWLLLIIGLLLWTLPGARRAVLVSCAVPVLIVVLLYVKNEALFGIPTTSSWAGMNLAEIAFVKLPDATKSKLIADGTLSSTAAIPPFSPLSDYPGAVHRTRRTGVAALDDQVKTPLPGQPDTPVNFNNLAYVAISKTYQHDALRLIETHPGIYLSGVKLGLTRFFQPSSDNLFLIRNRSKIGSWNARFNELLLWRFWRVSSISFALVLAYAVALAYGFWIARALRRSPSARTTVLAVTWLTVAWVALLTTFGEVSENQRLHFCLDPLVLLLDLAALYALFGRRTTALQ